jgi:glycosyltransferase involved in cell wall biosynthesis
LKEIGLWGVVRNGVNDGYGYAGFKMVETFEKLGVHVLWEDFDSPVALSFIQPLMYGGKSSQYRIGYTPWESTVLPEEWADIINKQDAFWTTSNFCAEVFKDQGVTLPIRVVHHGLDPEEWSPTPRRKTDEPFIFLHQGEPADRKGSQMVFDAFREVFGNNDKNIWLVFKSSSGWLECRWKDKEGHILGPVEHFPNVQTVKGVLTQPQMQELYAKASVMVYPSHGEGFGLIPFQAAATGLPTIAPAWGGIADYGEHIINLDYEVGPSNHGYHLGDWAWPSFEDLCTTMESVYLDYDSWADWQYQEAFKIAEKFRWEDIFEPIVADLDAYF